LLALVGLADRATDAVSRYSLGMKQRLGIAAALLSDPKLLLLDEPANGLDPAGIVAMRDTLRSLADSGKTVFVSSHILSEVQQLADVVGIIASGRLVREGPIGTLLASEAVLRVHVRADEVERAVAVLRSLPDAGDATPDAERTGWIGVRIAQDRASELTRALANAGIYLSALESGSDLESIFLELTADRAAPDTTAIGIGTVANT
jgi:ABC-2 type transport system ATP-binding protein